MHNWFRSPTLLKLFVGQHIVNGLSVALSVMAVAVAASALFGFAAGQPATLGAISASISDFPAPWRVKARTLLIGFGLALASTSAIQLVGGSGPAAIVAIGLIAFCAGMVTGLGRWALSLSAQLLVPMVFVLGLPPADPARAFVNEAIFAGGGLAYIGLALIATRLSGANDRRLMASECFRELAAYLRAIARFTDPAIDVTEVYGAAIRQQAALGRATAGGARLASRAAREPRRSGVRLAATIGILLDGFDALVAAQCDLPRLRDVPAARTLMARIGVALRAAALDLQHLSLELLTTAKPGLPPGHATATEAMRREAARLVAGEEASRGERDGDRSHDAASQRRSRTNPPPRARLEGRRSGGSGDRRSRPVRLRAAPQLRPPPADRPALHAGFAGVALRRPADRGDDGRRRSSRLTLRRGRPRQLGSADHRRHHARELRLDAPAARRPHRRHADRLRRRCGRASPICRSARWCWSRAWRWR